VQQIFGKLTTYLSDWYALAAWSDVKLAGRHSRSGFFKNAAAYAALRSAALRDGSIVAKGVVSVPINPVIVNQL